MAGLPILRPIDIPRIVEEKQIKRVLLAMPSSSQPKQMQIARRMQDLDVEVQVLPSFAQLIGAEPLIDKFTGLITESQAQGRVADDLHPYLAASALVSVLEKQPEHAPLRAGEIISTGTITTAHSVHAGQTWRSEFKRGEFAGLTIEFVP